MYTKGEWEIEHRKTRNYLEDKFDIVKPLKLVNNRRARIASVRCEDDAHLIAQAPRMYEALKAIDKALFFADDPIKQDTLIDEFQMIRTAITKAEGK